MRVYVVYVDQGEFTEDFGDSVPLEVFDSEEKALAYLEKIGNPPFMDWIIWKGK